MLDSLFGMLGNVGGGGGILGAIFGGGRAEGGAVDPGRAYFTGERGIELFVPSTAGTIIPNQRLGALAGSGGPLYYVDARGATNPAQTEMGMHRALIAMHGSAVRTSAQVITEMQRRMPVNARP